MRSRISAVALAWCVSATAVVAQTPRDLGSLGLEELMQVRVAQVFGAGDRLQPVTEVPSSVTIVTADEISRYGYRSLADVLGGVRGFYVTNDRNYSYVGARGFNRPGDYSTRVLLLVNGHRVNDNVYDQANIGAELGIDASMFDRVEIIRGPASSLYGTNALFAVVNVVTRTGASLNGVSLEVDGGTLGTRAARGSAGRRLANGIDFSVSGSVERSDGVRRLSLPAFGDGGDTVRIAENLDGEEATQVYGQVSVRDFTFSGTFGHRLKYVPTASFFTVVNAHDPAEQTTDGRAIATAQYARTVHSAHVTAEASLDSFHYEGVYPYAANEDASELIAYRDGSDGLRRTAAGRVRRALPGAQTLTVGGEFVDNVDQNQRAGYAFESEDNFVINQSSRQGAAYVQDDVRVRPWLLLNGGLRYDRYAHFSRTTPRAAAIVMPSPNHSLKYLYGRAFRAPNAYELYYYENTVPNLAPESVDTHEFAWEAYFGERVRTTVSTYRYKASQLVDLMVVDGTTLADRLGFMNSGTTRATGLELESELRLKRGVQGLANYTLQEAVDDSSNQRLTNSPRHMANLRFSVPGPLARSFASFEWRYLSTRATVTGKTVAPMSIGAINLSMPVGQQLTLRVNVRNLFDARYADPASDEHTTDAIQQNGRTLRVGLSWTFWRAK